MNDAIRLVLPAVLILVRDQVSLGLSVSDATYLVSKRWGLFSTPMRQMGMSEDGLKDAWCGALSEIGSNPSYYGLTPVGGRSDSVDCPERTEDPLYSDREYTTWGV